jgi:tRNA(Ile)-lysidine synthase
VLDRAALSGAVLRTRRAGDRFSPFGMEGSKSLSDFFTDRKLDPPLRDVTPVVARGPEILWVIGHAISRACALCGKEAVRLTCEYTGWGGSAR